MLLLLKITSQKASAKLRKGDDVTRWFENLGILYQHYHIMLFIIYYFDAQGTYKMMFRRTTILSILFGNSKLYKISRAS